MWHWNGPPQPSYDGALRSTFGTTYRNSYKKVDTLHDSPVYRERQFNPTPPAPDITYERDAYPYQEDFQDPPAKYIGIREPPPKHYHDYNNPVVFRDGPPLTERWDRPDDRERPYHSDYMNRPNNEMIQYEEMRRNKERRQYNEMLLRPEEKNIRPVGRNACVYCTGPETEYPKCTNQLGCSHKYCDDCMRKLHATDGPFRDQTALYYYCALCKGSRTPSPKIVRFDPYGRRIVKYKDVEHP